MLFISFIFLFSAFFLAFWIAMRPSSVEKRTEKRLREVARPAMSVLNSAMDAAGLLKPLNEGAGPVWERLPLWGWFNQLLQESNAEQTPKEVMMWQAGCSLILGLLVMLIVGLPLLALAAAALGLALPIMRLKFLRNRRVNKFEDALPDSLDLMARALRSGHAVSAAIEVVADQGREPVATEFKSLFQQQSYGLPFRDALETMMHRIPSADLQFAGTAMLVQKETGGNLAEILDRTVEIMRERAKIRGEVRTKTAQGKLTGIILALLPVVLLLIISFTNPEYAKNLTGTATGHKMLYASAGMITVGWLFIRKIVNIEI